ncbi:MAG: ABC transporter ATP-binding protein [Myxococcota bacterium]
MSDDTAQQPLLEVRDLHTRFAVEGRIAWAVQGVSFEVGRGEFLGVVGESGSGKSVTALSLLRLIPDPPGRIEQGEILLEGRDLMKLSYEQMRDIRGKRIAMIFQEPMTSLNPVYTIGMQVAETVQRHEGLDRTAARARAVEMLTRVGIPDAARRLDDYPHQFSGGMRQRVMIAMALICDPLLLIADEPTTALDVTIQAQILDLIQDLQRERGTAVVLITHDLAVVAETCQRVLVMYGGKIQEAASVVDLFDRPTHPYTRGLLASIPDRAERGAPLVAIPGNVPSIFDFPSGCRFRTRCPLAFDRCAAEEPALRPIAPGHAVRCHLAEAVVAPSAPAEATP